MRWRAACARLHVAAALLTRFHNNVHAGLLKAMSRGGTPSTKQAGEKGAAKKGSEGGVSKSAPSSTPAPPLAAAQRPKL